MRTGAEVAASRGWPMVRGTRVGVITNATGVTSTARHIVDDMAGTAGVEIAGIFGPEHGFRGTAQAGYSEGDARDPRSGLRVYDAYEASPDRFHELFDEAGAETILFDIQDVGARFYTYIWTMYAALVAAARAGLRFVVLDRPNPIGGRAAGPMLDPEEASGVGLKPILQQHGMTVGELVLFFNGEMVPDDAGRAAEVDVVRCEGWRADQHAQDLDLPWIPPSPNMPTADTATVYPGTCYLVGTNISEGRGTTRPFELVGAPYLDRHWADRLEGRGLPGARFRETGFVPTFGALAGQQCAGVQIHVSDRREFEPIPTAVAMLVEARGYAGFAWRREDSPAGPSYWIDKLSGSPRLRTMIDAGADVGEIVTSWRPEVAEFERRRRPYLLYPGREGL